MFGEDFESTCPAKKKNKKLVNNFSVMWIRIHRTRRRFSVVVLEGDEVVGVMSFEGRGSDRFLEKVMQVAVEFFGKPEYAYFSRDGNKLSHILKKVVEETQITSKP